MRVKHPWLPVVLLLLGWSSRLDAQSKPTIAGSGGTGGSRVAYPTLVSNANEVFCGISSAGSLCGEIIETPYASGGMWPQKTRNTHIFNSGLQVHGIVPRAATCTDALRLTGRSATCFRWSGDTTGAQFFDDSGTRQHGTTLGGVYSSRIPEHLDEWPGAGAIADFPQLSAFINDTTVFDGSLLGRKFVSDEDTWAAYWDGDPARNSGRVHPTGILVEQRTMMWRAPAGAEATMFIVWRITNLTNSAKFQALNETRFFNGQDSLPNEGWRIDSIYALYNADLDVTAAAQSNYMTVIHPFDMMVGYKDNFRETSAFSFPQSHFHAPFFPNATSMVGLYFLKTPASRGVRSFTQFTGGGAFPTPNTVMRAWRAASLNLDPSKGDAQCTFPLATARERRICFVSQVPADTRGSMSSGPFSLDPGKSETIIAAISMAATVATPAIVPGNDTRPGVPSLAPGCGADTVRAIEKGAGWVATLACPSSGELDASQVSTVPGSLLGKAAVAQAIVARKFVLPDAPAAPAFALVPGKNRVTVIWEPSATEVSGDPFADAATNPASVLHDPNFRTDDVEGYRIYRGTTPSNLALVAQFDRANTVFTDRRCATDPTYIISAPCDSTIVRPITHINYKLTQYRTIVSDANGEPVIVEADTVLYDDMRAGRSDYLQDTGVPFAWVDTDVRDGFQYYYRVTAFDVNSIFSAPSSRESASQTKSATPRSDASGLNAAAVETGLFGRSKKLPSDATVTIDPVTGTFSGPQPPASLLSGTFTAYADNLLQAGAREITIDSIVPSYHASGIIAQYHITVDGARDTITFTNRTSSLSPGTTETFDLPVIRHASDPGLRAALQAKGVDASAMAGTTVATIGIDRPLWNSLFADWAYKQPGFWAADPPTTSWAGGSRWFSGDNESMPDPTLDVVSHGRLNNVAVIFQPTPYRSTASPVGEPRAVATSMSPYRGLNEAVFRRFYSTVFGVTRAADVKFYWGNARLDSVIDVTHNVPVPFSSAVRASYGFLADNDGDGVLTYGDFYYLNGLATSAFSEINQFAQLAKSLAPQPVVMQADFTGDLAADGGGFGLYVNGEPYIFQSNVPSNTVWTLRTYNGTVAKSAAGVYTFTPTGRNPAVPSLRLATVVTAPATLVPADADLSDIHTVPDPYYASSIWGTDGEHRELHFVNMPPRATIRIYTLSGVLVDVINHDGDVNGGVAKWDLRGRGNHYVKSAVYLFHVSTPEGRQHVGRFTVIMAK